MLYEVNSKGNITILKIYTYKLIILENFNKNAATKFRRNNTIGKELLLIDFYFFKLTFIPIFVKLAQRVHQTI